MFSIALISIVLLIRYKPAYKVNIAGEDLGYVNNKEEIESAIDTYINDTQGCVAYINVPERPEYEFKFINNTIETSEEQLLLKVKDDSIITYRMYAIKLNGETKDYVENFEEAENIVASLKDQYSKDIEVDLTIEELYTEEALEVVSIETAKTDIDGVLATKLQEKKAAEAKAKAAKAVSRSYSSRMSGEKVSLGSVTLIKPVNGQITSRFGERSSIRSSAHTGLDIYVPYGTSIKAAAAGTVTCAGYSGSYGNLVIISHGEGVETWYAHCSSINVSVGNTVSQGQGIAAVGSSGNATGPHLHLEVRKDGTILNPQNYVY